MKTFTKERMTVFLSSENCGWVFKMSKMPITDESWFNSRLLQETLFLQSMLAGCGAHPFSSLVSNGGCFPEG
jgi:hypothetical protein